MKLGYAILYVDSVAETIAFYERAFGLIRGMVTDTNEYGELQTGDTKLAFAANAFVKALVSNLRGTRGRRDSTAVEECRELGAKEVPGHPLGR